MQRAAVTASTTRPSPSSPSPGPIVQGDHLTRETVRRQHLLSNRVIRSGASAFVGALLVCCQARSVAEPRENDAWKAVASSPIATYEAQGAVLAGRLVVFGGFYDGATRATTSSEAYSPATDRWTSLAPMPEAITHAGHASDGRYVYFAGGFVGNHPGPNTAHVWRYDSVEDSWRALPDLPAPRGGGAAAIVGRELHFFGGAVRNGLAWVADAADHWALSLDTLAAWRPRSPLPNPRNHLAAINVGGTIYAIGGQHLGDEERGNQASVNAYDATADEWRAVADMPASRSHVAASVVDWHGTVVVIGGLGQSAFQLVDVIAYDPVTDQWSALPSLPAPRQSPVAGNVGDRLLVATGSNNGPRSTTWELRR